MTITAVEITNVKGIKHHKFDVQLMPNKPNLIAAPNGSGKSSLAAAFASMNSQRMDMDKDDRYKCDDANQPRLLVTFEDASGMPHTLEADSSTNTILKHFDVTVIRSGLVPKATKRKIAGFTQASASMEIQSIPICKVPARGTFGYQYSSAKSAFGVNGKVLPNIGGVLQDVAICGVVDSCDLGKTRGTRIHNAISAVVAEINQQSGTSESICQWIQTQGLGKLRAIPHLSDLAAAMTRLEDIDSEAKALLAAIQIVDIYKSDTKAFDSAIEWLRYTAIKRDYSALLQGYCSSDWRWPEIKEIRKGGRTELCVVFPPAHQLSNGQRDIITIIVQMHRALYASGKKPLILIIDEVFDYLDDANLVAFQYYVTGLIEAYKKRGLALYPLLLTHLDPGIFFDFCFNKHKIHIHYLYRYRSGKSANTVAIIEQRDNNTAIKDRLEEHWFHYNPVPCTIPESEWPTVMPLKWRDSDEFHKHAMHELAEYLADRQYDPVAVCFAIRITIEQKVYQVLASGDRKDFLAKRRTREKLSLAADRLADIPEAYFLLGLIYNSNLHWKQGKDYDTPLTAKFGHPTIKALIRTSCSSGE
jgi:hypothetical protein